MGARAMMGFLRVEKNPRFIRERYTYEAGLSGDVLQVGEYNIPKSFCVVCKVHFWLKGGFRMVFLREI